MNNGSFIKTCIISLLLTHWPRPLVDYWWKKRFGYTIDWEHPRDINEKIWWLIVYSDTTEWTRLSDKIKVREYVKEKGLESILNPLLGIWDDAKKIDFDQLPQKFILKCNHDSGSAIIVDKNNGFSKEAIIKSLNDSLKRDYGLNGELQYYRIYPHQIFAEPLIEFKNTELSKSLIDYKIWCFDGTPKWIWTCQDRTKDSVNTNLWNLDWNVDINNVVEVGHYKIGKGNIPKPKNLAEMLRVASVLSEGFPEVRIDLYNVDGRIYFGEMTFTSMRGMMHYFTPEFLKVMGNQVNLKKAKRK